jgi:uncharacterized protein (DUF1684 family)
MVGWRALKILLPLTRIVLIFCIAGLLFFVPRARRTLGAYRIPRKPAFSSHLVTARKSERWVPVPASRFLDTDGPNGKTVQLDFNKAYNPPCAYNPYTTCPIPLPANRLRAEIFADEKLHKHLHP